MSPLLSPPANYSAPVLTHIPSGEETTFNCTSSHGYPQPKVYWVNHTDISLLNSTQQYTRAPDGTITVFSTLTVKAATAIKLECTIENEQLHQNLTATSKLMFFILSPLKYFSCTVKYL